MSDTTPIQDTPAVPAGAVSPLASDSRTGASDVNTLSFCRGAEVGATSQISTARTSPNAKAPTDSASINSGLSVTGRQAEQAKPVDFRAVEGSYAGDHRSKPGDVAAASLAKASTNGGPRQPAGQAPFGRNTDNPPVKTFPGLTLDSDAGN
jgi:hypothetical protein